MTQEISEKDIDVLRKMLQYEGEQIHRRLTWLGTFQGFIFAALSFAWTAQKASFLINIFCVLGISISALTFAGMVGGSLAIKRLMQYWIKHLPLNYDGLGVIGFMPKSTVSYLPFLSPENLIPLVFCIIWIIILIFH